MRHRTSWYVSKEAELMLRMLSRDTRRPASQILGEGVFRLWRESYPDLDPDKLEERGAGEGFDYTFLTQPERRRR